MKKIILMAAIAAFSAGSIQANTLYRWQDSAGVTHYSDKRPPKGVKFIIEVFGEEEPSNDSAPPAVAIQESAACKGARRNLQILSVTDADIMMDVNGDGQTEKLESGDVDAQKKLAQAQIDAYCAVSAVSSDAAEDLGT